MKTFIIICCTVVAVALIFVVVPYLIFGYVFVYSKTFGFELEHTYFVLSSIGAIATLFAIIVAIYMPRKIAKRQNDISEQQNEIADQQNKIALFEKRFELYTIYSFFNIYVVDEYDALTANMDHMWNKYFLAKAFIKDLIYPKGIQRLIILRDVNEEENAMLGLEIGDHLRNFILELEKIKYLFSVSENEIDVLSEIISKLKDISEDFKNNEINFYEFKENVIALYDYIKDSTVHTTMQQQLKLD